MCVNSHKIKLPNYAKLAMSTLLDNSFEAWVVGGFVRDSLILDKITQSNLDIDITTNASPDTVLSLFKNSIFNIYEVGKKYGTIGLAHKQDNSKIIEITTYRTESSYDDNRHPDNISFANNIDEDLKRRDFTINAIAYNPVDGIYDPFDGLKDIKNKIIRCVGDPDIRFCEDYLRILRAIRFSAQLGFSIEENTHKSINLLSNKVTSVSAERINSEMTKLLTGKASKDVLLQYANVIFKIIPELGKLYKFDQKTKYHSYDAYTHTCICVDKMPHTTDEIQNICTSAEQLIKIGKWAALLHDIGKPECFTIDENGQGHFYGHPKVSYEISKRILKRYKFSKSQQEAILLLIRYHDQPMVATDKSVRKMLRKFNVTKSEFCTNDLFRIYCCLRRADSYAHAEKYRENLLLTNNIESTFENILELEMAFSLKDLKICGRDIIDLGFDPGPIISKILNECLDAVIEGTIENKHDNLIEYIKTTYC